MAMMIARPIDDVFQNAPVSQARIMKSVEYPKDGGMRVFYHEHAYPENSFPYPEAIYCIDPVKRSIWCPVQFIIKHKFFSALAISTFFLPGGKKRAQDIIKLYADFTHNALNKIYLKNEERYCTSGRELNRVGKVIAENFSEEWKSIVLQFTKTFCLLWQNDNAYRYRFQDVVPLLNKESFFADPTKEILRVAQILIDRETGGLKNKWSSFSKIISLAMRHRLIRKIICDIVTEIDLSKIAMDENDVYWSLHRGDYNMGGDALEVRLQKRLAMANKNKT